MFIVVNILLQMAAMLCVIGASASRGTLGLVLAIAGLVLAVASMVLLSPGASNRDVRR